MRSKYKLLVKDSFVFAIGDISSKLILFLLVPLYTNYLTTGDYGSADLVINLSSLVVMVISLSANHAVLRFAMDPKEIREDVLMTALVAQLPMLFFSLFLIPIYGLYKPIEPLRLYLVIQVIMDTLSLTGMAYLKAIGRNKVYAVTGVVKTAVLAALNILFLGVFKMGVHGYLLVNNIASFITVIIPFVFIRIYGGKKRGHFSKELCLRMIRYSMPLIVGSVCWWVMQFADRYVVERFMGTSDQGVYSLATKMMALINLVTGIFYQSWGISSIREVENENETSFFSNIYNVYSISLIGFGVLLISVIKPFMHIYIGKGFADSANYTPILLAGAVFYGISLFYGVLYEAHKKTAKSVVPVFLCAISDILLCVILIPRIGLWGASLAYLSSNLIYMLFMMWDTRKFVIIELDRCRFVVSCIVLFGIVVAVSADFHVIPISVVAVLLYFAINSRLIKEWYGIIKKWI